MQMIDFEDLLQQQSPDASIVTTTVGQILHWNKGAESMFGYREADSLGHCYVDLIIPPDRQEQERRAIEENTANDCRVREIICCRQNGLLLYASFTAALAHTPTDGRTLIILAVKDVTAVRIERDVKLLESRFGSLLESIPDGIVLVNPTGHIVLANRECARLFGYARGELLATPIETLLPPRLRDAHHGHRLS